MGLLDGKCGLVFGVANHRSYAWHIARALLAEGARCAFSTLPDERMAERTRDAVARLGVEEPWIVPCDAARDEDLDRIFDEYGRSFDRLDFIVHSIAFADREWLAPDRFAATPRGAFQQALDISAYSLVAMARRGRDRMAAGG
ncbi:MAG: SDR family oxidoreductase, partial [Acidobacteria bacterium]